MEDDPLTQSQRKRSSHAVDEAMSHEDTTLVIGRMSGKLRSSSDSLEVFDDLNDNVPLEGVKSKPPSWKNYAMLIVLYYCQGIPMGLIFGTIPFLLKSLAQGTTQSYADIGLFALASQPYTLKFLWSPLVDSVYDKRLGRRKSWIIPMLLVSGLGLVYLGYMTPELFPASGEEGVPVGRVATLFGVLVVFCATQDIAVDGWALTLLDRDHIQSSSTCQTIGLNAGYFTAFTVYLTLASPEFCSKYLPSGIGILDLGTFLQACGILFLLAIILVVRMKAENGEIAPKAGSTRLAYKQMFRIVSLPNVRKLTVVLLVGKLGFIAGETLTPLKLLDRGFPKESLAITMLVDFACQLVLSWVAVRWTIHEGGKRHPLRPWQVGCYFKTVMALVGMWVVSRFPEDGELTNGYFAMVQVYTILSSFASTLMLVSLGSFFSTVGDPSVGGTYMTLLNTLSNLGSTWPRLLALTSVDCFTRRLCTLDPRMAASLTGPFQDACDTDDALATCTRLGGRCGIVADGYFVVTWMAVVGGVLVMRLVVRPLVWRIEGVPISSWRISA